MSGSIECSGLGFMWVSRVWLRLTVLGLDVEVFTIAWVKSARFGLHIYQGVIAWEFSLAALGSSTCSCKCLQAGCGMYGLNVS